MRISEEAYELFKDIPEENWITGHYTDSDSKCCAAGHWIRLKTDPNDYSYDHIVLRNITYDIDLRAITRDFLQIEKNLLGDIANVNNCKIEIYNQPSPKQRVLAFLKEMIQAGY